jgi:hypothetical protein
MQNGRISIIVFFNAENNKNSFKFYEAQHPAAPLLVKFTE